MNYNLLFVWLALAALAAKSGRMSYLTNENGYEQIQTTKRFAVVVFIPIIIFVCTSTWRYWGDYPRYLNEYSSFPTAPSIALSFIAAQKNSMLFHAFTYLIKIIFGGNVFTYRLSLAILQSVPCIYFFRKYSTDYVFSVYIFVASAIPIAWMLNGVRQLVAAVIIYAATPLFVEKKYIKSILLVLFASQFHQTAILMIPVIFVVQGEAWNKKTNLAIIGAVIVTLYIGRNAGASESILEAAGYNTDYLVSDDGIHPLRVLVSFVPVLMAYIGRSEIKNDNYPAINVFINMSIISFAIHLVAMVTSGILVGRVPLYMSFYSFILLPYLIRRLFNDSMGRLIKAAAVVSYGLYYYLQYAR